MGAVYVVEQLSTGRERALKVLLPKVVDDPRNREGFGLEARVGSRIASRHVVEIVAAGIDDATGAPWLAMELLRGECLWDRVARAGPLSREQASVLFDQLGDALSKAHRAGVVHRDLKPENLFVAEARIKGVPFVLKVLDFGIARLIAHDRTAATSTRAIGSPLWLAPEQTQSGAKLRPATDVWALGLIAFWSLTGRSFWRAANSEEFNLTALLMEVAVNPIPAASTRAAELGVDAALPPGFDAWFARCVTRAPEDRHVDAGAAIPALLALLSATTSTAPRPRTEVLDDPLPIAPTAAMPVVPPGPPAQTVAMPVVPIAPPPKTEAMPVVPMVRSTTEAMPVAPSPTGPQTAGRVPATTPQSGGWLVPAGLGAATLLAVGVWASQRPSTTVDAQDGSAVIAAQDASEGSPATPVVGGPAEIMVRHILVQYRGVQRAVVGVTRTRDEALRRAQGARACGLRRRFRGARGAVLR
ncbi:MAG: protein kinase [Polyangiales bacterium]